MVTITNGNNNKKKLSLHKKIKHKLSLISQIIKITRYKMLQQGTINTKCDGNWGTTLYTKTDSDTLTVQGEIYQMDSNPIICIGLEDHQMTKPELEQVQNTTDKEEQAQIRKCIYILNTLDPEETTKYNKLRTPEETTAFLATLVEEVEAGKRELRVYQPPRGLTPKTYLDSGETLRQGMKEKVQWLKNHPRLTIQVKPRTLGDKLEGATQAGTEAEQTMPQSTRTDQTKEDSLPQEGAVTLDSLNLGETRRP